MVVKRILLVAVWPLAFATLSNCSAGDSDTGGDSGTDGDTDSDSDTDLDAGDNLPTDIRMVDMLEAHNDVRTHAIPTPNPLLNPLIWSERLAADAREWSATCVMAHDPATGDLNQGENWYAWSAANNRTPENVVQAWASEAEDYDYQTHTCNGGDAIACGHYTQIVWSQTTHVGCAVQVCPNGLENWDDGREIWICRYYPAGNWIGEKPY